MNSEQQIRAAAAQDAVTGLDLAVERTSLALKRTQLSWVRTVIGLITAGLAIDKGTEALHAARLVSGAAWAKNGHFAGMLLSIIATTLMIIVTVIFTRDMDKLNKMRGMKQKLPSPTTILSIFICLFGGIAIYFLHMSW